jgi:exosortase
MGQIVLFVVPKGAYCIHMSSTKSLESSTTQSEKLTDLYPTFAILGGLLIFFTLLFWRAIERVSYICWNNDDYSHGLILPFVVVYIYRERAKDLILALRTSTANKSVGGLVLPALLLFLSLVLHLLGEISSLEYASWIALFPSLFSTLWLMFGFRTALALSTPFFLLLMARPLPDSVVLKLFWPMQVLAAKVSAFSLRLCDVPVYLQGNIIEIPSMRLLVEQACSGMRSSVSLLSLAVIANYFTVFKIRYKIALIVAALVIALVMNVLRVAATGLLAHFVHPDTAKGFFHSFSGLIVFIIAMPLLLLVGRLLSKLQGQAPQNT